ncbi:unnamed protein product [Allacma fusca]|uniref:Uncharacterized protein n=1 Tax=Allacma fusca TaxID=39272 RepID=A0A8J2NJ79_9HEXA|nr:unnamed protein product [Allacma fusca]
MSKVIEYVGWVHALKDRLKENWTQFWHSETEEKETNFRAKVKDKLEKLTQRTITRINHSSNNEEGDFSHLTRSKTRMELVQISAAVMGIEFSYAAETAFVSPLLLNIGLRHRHMTLMWCLSPLLGFFVTPLLGSVSDGCRSRLGRRRPFIILLSIGIILGLILVPNGKTIGLLLGDTYKQNTLAKSTPVINTTEKQSMEGNFSTALLPPENQTSNLKSESLLEADFNPIENSSYMMNPEPSYKHAPHQWVLDDSGRADNFMGRQFDDREQQDIYKRLKLTHLNQKNEDPLTSLLREAMEENNGTTEHLRNDSFKAASLTSPSEPPPPTNGDDASKGSENENEDSIANHPWGLIFTVIGTVLLDFDADACQSPSRAYMLDVTIPEDHARGLSTFTIMAGLGGSMGYFLGALNWENTFIGILFGGQVRAVFTVVLFIFIGCVITTIRSFQEIPIDRLYSPTNKPSDRAVERGEYSRFEEEESYSEAGKSQGYGSIENVQETSFNENQKEIPPVAGEVVEGASSEEKVPEFREYLKTIVQMPRSLQWLCVTNFFCWMSLVCYSLYFTDFVGEAVYGGDPTAPLGSISRTNYEDGVRFGCWGMSLYSLSCSFYSFAIDGLVHRFGAKRVYICGQLVYSVGMVFMGTFRHRAGVIIFSWTAGIMYATLFTMPYLLVARYHAAEMFDVDHDDLVQKPNLKRGLGTDVAIVSSMVFLAQMTQAVILGSVVTAAGTPTAIVYAAAIFASCGALAATKVLYLDL